MKKLFTFLLAIITGTAIAQCGNGSVFVSGSLTPPGVGQSTSLTFNSGQYALAYVQGGANYQVSTCNGTSGLGPNYDTQLTVYEDASGTFLAYNDDYCGLQSTVNFTPSFCGYVRILLHQYSCNGSNLPYIVTMTQNSAGNTQTYTLSATASQTNISCFGAANGTASVQPIGTSGAVRYNWAPSGGTSATATGLSPGIYTVTVSDGTCNGVIQTYTITEPAQLIVAATQTNVSCFGDSNGIAEMSVSGGIIPYVYSWSPSGGAGAAAFGLSAGNYTNNISDANGCTATGSVNITEPSIAVSSATAATNILCFGNSTGSATITATGGTPGYTYLWSTAATASVITGETAGVKTVTVTDANGCTMMNTVTITEPSIAMSSATIASNVSCFGNSTGSATITATGGTPGYGYLWSTAATGSVITGQTAGVKTVTVTDANGCTTTNSVSITQPATGLSATQTQTNVTCVINGMAAVSVSGGTGTYSYTWSPTGGNAAGSTILAPGSYTCLTEDVNNCTFASVFSITANTVAPTVTISGNTAICNGLTSTLTVSGANTYTWNTGATTSTVSVSPVATTGYSVTGTNTTNGCTTMSIHTLTVNPIPTLSISVSQASVCPGQSSTLTVGGASTYTWSNGSNATSVTVTPLASVIYTVTGTSAAGCINATVQSISLFPSPSINLSNIGSLSGSVCAGSSSTLVATGVNTYTWSTGSNNASIVIMPATAASYSVAGTDVNGCASSGSISIGVMNTPVLNAVASNTGVCNGFSSNLSVSGASVYVWSTGETNSTITVNPNTTTAYHVTGTNASGCSSSATVTVLVYASPVVSLGSDVEVASGSTHQFNPTQSGVVSYTWSPSTYLSAADIANPVTTPDNDITYILTVSSANGCLAGDTIVVTLLRELIIANYMSPNGDGQNDTWKVSLPLLIKDYNITIIDSYGKTVYSKSDNYNNEFDGTLGGQDLPDGVYYYFIKDKDTTKYKGSITLTK